ncbi:MAG: PAS domain S-box protein, partial [Smithellaceae bacterium]|nr:PAS domain S-box protein [Smithellaceae bacterium]
MVYLDLIFNLSLLVALSVVSGFIDKRWPRETRPGQLLQGALFGAVTVLGMLRPLILGPGLIFDGRSVMLSLCALFFGPLAAAVSCVMALACRISIGGVGLIMGILTSLSSTAIGLIFFYRNKSSLHPPSAKLLYVMGLVVHATVAALMFTLPGSLFWSTFQNLAAPILLLFPLATLLAGKILSDHLSMMQSAAALSESEGRYKLLFEASLDAVMLTAPDGRILSANPAVCRLLGYSEEELIALGRGGIMDREDPRLALALDERERTGKFAGELTMIRKDGAKIPVEITTAVFEDRFGQARTSMIIRDITRRLQEEESLKKLQTLLAETQKLSKIGGWEIDLTTGRGQWTEETYKIYGISPNVQISNEEAMNFYAPEDRPVIDAAFRRLLKTGEAYDLELRFNKATGETIRVRTIGQAEWRDGKIVRVFGNIMDVT